MSDLFAEILAWVRFAKAGSHPFYGNQYTDGGVAANKALEAARIANEAAHSGDTEKAFRQHIIAAHAHRDASDASTNKGDKVMHRIAAEAHDYAASAVGSGKRLAVIQSISDHALKQSISASPKVLASA